MAQQIEDLRAKIKGMKDDLVDGKEVELSSVGKGRDYETSPIQLKTRRRLEGHFGKIYAFAWGPESVNLVSASQDGNMFVWNGIYGLKMQGITLRSSWVMCCGYSPGGRFVSTAGLDNVVWIYEVKEGATDETHCELSGHEGYISSCTFLDDEKMLTTSGDCTAALWDVSNRKIISEFIEHELDVNCLAVSPDKNLFVTGSCDAKAKVWDLRAGTNSIRTFIGHDTDVNAISFFPDGNAFFSGSDDSTCRLFDIRAYGQLSIYNVESQIYGVTSNAVSKSGKYLFSAYDSGPVHVWDTVTGDDLQKLEGHDKRVSRVRVSPDGYAVGTASWDTSLMIWA
jgi:WD40 repeat protein